MSKGIHPYQVKIIYLKDYLELKKSLDGNDFTLEDHINMVLVELQQEGHRIIDIVIQEDANQVNYINAYIKFTSSDRI